MKVLFCLNHFLPEKVAGTEIYTFTLAAELKKLFLEPVILIPNFGKSSNETYFYQDIKVIKYAETSVVDRKLIQGLVDPNGLPSFIEILKTEKPDIVHFQEVTSSNGIIKKYIEIAKNRGCAVFLTMHLSGYSCKTGNLLYKNEEKCDGVINMMKCTWCNYTVRGLPLYKRQVLYSLAMVGKITGFNSMKLETTVGTAIGFPYVIKKLKTDLISMANDCNKIVVLTKWYADILVKNGIPNSKIEYIPQGLSGKQIEKKNTISEHGKLRMVFLGRISPLKGVHLILESLLTINPSDIHLDIYGDADDMDYYNNCVSMSSKMLNVTWKGRIESKNVVEILTAYDLLCLASTFSEMSPLIIQEAFAAGIPVLASNVYGNAEQIDNGVNGWLFDFNDSKDLSRKLSKVIVNRDLITKAKSKIPEVRSFAEVATEYKKMYDKVGDVL